MAAMLAAILLGAASDASGDVMQGVVGASQAMAIQRQINFTRANEYEADRVGMEVLSSAGFDPNGMSSFFEKLGKRYGASTQYIPELLQTHPGLDGARSRSADARAAVAADEGNRQHGLRLGEGADPSPERTDAGSCDGVVSRPEARARRRPIVMGSRLASMRLALNDTAEQLFRESERRTSDGDRVQDRASRSG